MGAGDYLETALAPLPGTDAATTARNAIRESIRGLFPDRDCVALVRPMHDEQVGLICSANSLCLLLIVLLLFL
jgi:Guanylate-binding protein, N-terminal domain